MHARRSTANLVVECSWLLNDDYKLSGFMVCDKQTEIALTSMRLLCRERDGGDGVATKPVKVEEQAREHRVHGEW